MIVTLCSGSAFGSSAATTAWPGLVIRAVHAIELAQDHRAALDAHQHLVARFLQVVVGDHGAAGAAGEQRRLVDQVGEVRAREPGRAARDRAQVDVRLHRDLARVHAEDRFAPLQVGIADRHLPIEAAGAQQRRIEDVLPVGRGDDDDAGVAFEAVHLDEQLVERLLALFVAQRVAAAAAADGVELVDEDDAGAVAAGLLEQPAHARRADAGVHLDEVGAAGEEERHARFTGDRARQQRLAGSRGADEQHALGDPAAERRESLGFAQEVDDLLDLVLGLVDAGDVLEGDDVVAACRRRGPGPTSTECGPAVVR